MDDKSTSRRFFLRAAVGATVAGSMGLAGWASAKGKRPSGMTLRPPGAVGEDEFLAACTRCFKCSNVCPNDCIKTFDLKSGLDKAFTPYIKARERGCTLCGECADVCPTGALKPFKTTRQGWLDSVAMGTARVNKSMCFSYHGRTCGACYQACPLAGTAMKIGIFETPIVVAEDCVGCGLCEQACLHLPQAIRVLPNKSGVPMEGRSEIDVRNNERKRS